MIRGIFSMYSITFYTSNFRIDAQNAAVSVFVVVCCMDFLKRAHCARVVEINGRKNSLYANMSRTAASITFWFSCSCCIADVTQIQPDLPRSSDLPPSDKGGRGLP